jgi:hypothetical protein
MSSSWNLCVRPSRRERPVGVHIERRPILYTRPVAASAQAEPDTHHRPVEIRPVVAVASAVPG